MGAEFNPSKLFRAKDSVLSYINPRRIEHTIVTPIGNYEPGIPLEQYAIHFSGYGSPQVPGMESPLRQIPQIDNLYNKASVTLGKDLSALTEEELRLTVNAQPAITLLDIGSYLSHELCFPEELVNDPDVISSQSLGMLSAAWFGGMFGNRQSEEAIMLAIELSQTRGEIMQRACDFPYPETGHVLVRAGGRRKKPNFNDLAALNIIRKETLPRDKDVSLALDVSRARIIVGGKKTDLKNFHKKYREEFSDLNISFYNIPTSSGAFHTKYMKPIVEEIAQMLERSKHLMQNPVIPLLSNSYEEPRLIRTVDEFIDEMQRLCTGPVYGQAMEKYLTDRGISTGLEFGQRGIIANSLDEDFFEMRKRQAAVAGTVLATGAIITTAILINRRKKGN